MISPGTPDGRAAGRWPAWLRRLTSIADSPRRTAAAFAIGVFLSFSPLLGVQIAAALGLSVALRLNRIAVLAGVCMNMPWVMVPWYALTTAVGAAVLGVPVATDVTARMREILAFPVYREAFWDRAADLLGPFLWSYLLGSTVGALLLGALAYGTAVRVIARARGNSTS